MNVKPGDMAIVVWPSGFAGATCTVLEAAACPPYAPDSLHWLVRFPRPMAWGTVNNPGDMPDSELRKIAGPDVRTDINLAHRVSA